MRIMASMTIKHNQSRRVRLSVALAEAGLGLSTGHLSKLIRAGKVPAHRVGGLWYTSAAELRSALVADPANKPAEHP
jgi:hypothetical protein